MQPYYKDETNTIYLHDCITGMAELPEGLMDSLVTSPPYNVGEQYEQGVDFGTYLKLLYDLYAQGFRIIKKGGYAIVNIDPYYYTKYSGDDQRCLPVEYLHHVIAEHTGWIHECTRTWQKDFATLSDRYSIGTLLPKGEAEVLMVFRKPGGSKKVKPREQDIHSHQIWSTAGVKQAVTTRKHHQAAFPERLVQMILSVYNDKGDTIVDPFMGSGTTLAVARNFGMSAVGFELDPAECDLAAIRCSQQMMAVNVKNMFEQPELPTSAIALPVNPPPDDF